jgi:hypothetical protein
MYNKQIYWLIPHACFGSNKIPFSASQNENAKLGLGILQMAGKSKTLLNIKINTL